MKPVTKLVILVVVLVGAFLGVNNFILSYQQLEVSFSGEHSGLTAKLYKATVENDEASAESLIQKENLVKEFEQNETLRLKKGAYILATSGGDYAPQANKLYLENEKKTIVISAKLSSDKLKEKLSAEIPAILAVIKGTFPGVTNTYTVGLGELFENGEWYGTVLSPKLSTETQRLSYVDIYRLVLRKEQDGWKVITLPPELVLSSRKYPNIPKGVLSQTNKQY